MKKKESLIVDARAACARCGSARVVPLVFGYPTVEMERDAARGLLALGGCLVDVDEDDCVPAHRCIACGADGGQTPWDWTLDGPNAKSLAMCRTPEQQRADGVRVPQKKKERAS